MPETKPIPCPNGPIEIRTIFGDIDKFISSSKGGQLILDPAFERKYIVRIKLPFPVRLAGNHKKKISLISCHALMEKRFKAVFEEIGRNGSTADSLSWGGCFNFRPKRNGCGLSTHS
jgi:hypothetical protein